MNVQARITVLEESTSQVKALASITIENCFVVTGIRVIASQKGDLFTSMPSRKLVSGEYKDICYPITAECRAMINDEILKAYYEKLGQQEQQSKSDFTPPFDDSDLPF
jgi:stage V sporulation protein G